MNLIIQYYTGINPQSLRGTNTGVYIGHSTFGQPDGFLEDCHGDFQENLLGNMAVNQGQAKSLYSNRISFVLDLKGPSQVIDTACSSSLYAIDTALKDMRLGLN